MTTPTVVDLPPPGYPMLTRVVSNVLFSNQTPEQYARQLLDTLVRENHPQRQVELIAAAMREAQSANDPITWVIGQKHPLIADMRVVRMFVGRGGVEIYSVSADGLNGMRNLVPITEVRLIEEAVPIEIFVNEITASESGEYDDDDDLDDDDEDDDATADGQPEQHPVAAALPNGQASTGS